MKIDAVASADEPSIDPVAADTTAFFLVLPCTIVGSDGVPFAALAEREGVSRSYFTRVVRLSYLAPDITQAILDGRQPRDLTADKLLAHSRLPLAWPEQRTALGFA